MYDVKADSCFQLCSQDGHLLLKSTFLKMRWRILLTKIPVWICQSMPASGRSLATLLGEQPEAFVTQPIVLS